MKMIKFILMFVVLFVVPQTSFTQHFQRLHDCDTTSDFGTNIFVLPDGTYLTFSASLSYTTNRRESIWMNISADGTTSSNVKRVASDSCNYYQGLNTGEVQELSDGNYLLPYNARSNGKSALGIIKLNSQFDTVFTRLYTDTNIYNEDISACVVMPNGDFVIGGYSAMNGSPMDSALVIRTDSFGQLKWKQKFKKVPGEEACVLSLDVLDSNRILVGLMSIHDVWVSQFDYYGHSPPWFMILDSLGNVLKDTFYTTNIYRGGGRIYKDLHGGYYHIGSFDSCYTQDPWDEENFPEYIAHINEDFEIDWVRNFGTWDGHKAIWRVEQLSNGNFQLSGANAVNLDPRLRGWAARLDHNGWTIWDNDYTCDEDYSSYLVDFDVKQDGSLILVGAARNDTVPQWRGQELWLVSVDSNGCLIPGCAPTIVKPLEQKKEEQLLVYPNPTTGEFTADAKDEGSGVISDLQGREIKRIHIVKGKNEMSLPVGLASGVYLLQYRTAHGNVNVRLIKE